MQEVVNIIKYAQFIEVYDPVMEEYNGVKAVKYYPVDSPEIESIPKNRVWSFVNWYGAQYIVPGLQVKYASMVIVTNKPWGINDSGLKIEL